jgi:hypothetical protein
MPEIHAYVFPGGKPRKDGSLPPASILTNAGAVKGITRRRQASRRLLRSLTPKRMIPLQHSAINDLWDTAGERQTGAQIVEALARQDISISIDTAERARDIVESKRETEASRV